MSKSNELIYELYNQNYLSEKDVITLLKLLISEKNLENYVKNIIINQNDNKAGGYIISDKAIYINIADIINHSHNWMNRFPDQFSERFSIRFANLQILETINHELRHANQVKEADSKKNDPVHIIIKEGIDLGRHFSNKFSIKEKLFYKLHYENVLIERDASITSLIELLNTNKELGIISPFEIEKYIYPKLIKVIRNGYTKNSNPAKKYFKLRKKIDIYNSFNFYTNSYDDITKLSWGLPIEYGSINNKDKILTKVLPNKQNK